VNVDTKAVWPFVRNVVVDEPDQLDSVKQLLLDFHSPRLKPARLSNEDLVEMIYYARQLKARGFEVFRQSQTRNCCQTMSAIMPSGVPEKCCQQTLYVNRRFVKN